MAVIKNQEVKFHFLMSSSIFVAVQPHEIQTVLGSCVAVCLYDTKQLIGGMNHFMMPLWNGEGLASPKFGNIAIDLLIEKMLKAGAEKKNIIAKIFGGASQLAYSRNSIMVGERNAQITENILIKYKIPIAAKSLCGTKGRKIVFNTYTGQVLMKYIM
ncbi:MAG: chemotaxis protein CheD [Bacteroidota bacterium]|jgi:chemotaxis protein CheD|nr:chemotaxis protein CheD [Bacteroidota bacterium]